MAVSGRRLVIDTTDPVRATLPEGDNVSGHAVLVNNRSPVSIDLGGPDVAAGGGFELEAGRAMTFDLGTGEALYVACDGNDRSVHILERGV